MHLNAYAPLEPNLTAEDTLYGDGFSVCVYDIML